jgi:hypothetical protein
MVPKSAESSIRIIKVGGDVIKGYFPQLLKTISDKQIPTIILASPYGNSLKEIRSAIATESLSGVVEGVAQLFSVDSDSSKEMKGYLEQFKVNIDKAISAKNEAKVITALCKLSAYSFYLKLKNAGIGQVRFVSSDYVFRTSGDYLSATIADVPTMERLKKLVSSMSVGDVVVIPAYIGAGSSGEPTYFGDNTSESIAAHVAELVKTVSNKRTWLTILAPAWYNLHPKWAEQNSYSHLEHVPFLTVEEVLTTANFMFGSIVEATVRGVVTEIADVTTGRITRIVKNRSNVEFMPIVAIAGYECMYLEVKRSLYLLHDQYEFGDGAELIVDNTLNQLTDSDTILRVSYPTSIVRCLMFKDLDYATLSDQSSVFKDYMHNAFNASVEMCDCTLISIIGEGVNQYKDVLRAAIKKNLSKKGFVIRRYMDDDDYSITLVIEGKEMSGHGGSLEIISKATLNLVNSNRNKNISK